MGRIRTTILGGVALALLSVAPLGAMAETLYSYDGYDYSFNYGSVGDAWMGTCDQESDGNGAYSNFQTSGSGSTFRLEDPNGSAAGCGYGGAYNAIYRHRTCEDIAFQPDSCGDYVYPTY